MIILFNPFESVTLERVSHSHVDPPTAPPTNMYIVTVCVMQWFPS